MTQVAAPPQTLKPSAEGEGWKARPIRLKIFGNLIAEVVHKGICMYCGACIASCPIDILFHSDNEEPIMRGTCAACQVCYYSCPRIELPVAEIEQRVQLLVNQMRILSDQHAAQLTATERRLNKLEEDLRALRSEPAPLRR